MKYFGLIADVGATLHPHGTGSTRLHVTFTCFFYNSCSIERFFKFKDAVPDLLSSSVVYRFACAQCSATYIGETSRHLYSRIAEHQGRSPRTGQLLKNVNSNVFKHFLDTGHDINTNNFEILTSAPNGNLKILESVFIEKLKPSLNLTVSSTPLTILG